MHVHCNVTNMPIIEHAYACFIRFKNCRRVYRKQTCTHIPMLYSTQKNRAYTLHLANTCLPSLTCTQAVTSQFIQTQTRLKQYISMHTHARAYTHRGHRANTPQSIHAAACQPSLKISKQDDYTRTQRDTTHQMLKDDKYWYTHIHKHPPHTFTASLSAKPAQLN
eukprot:GDKI01048579.1.p1 GENE.GDKI01048579.1~~GDKI01048579.1.p1  ORF type:complete len:165 (+),score=20.02 GDKI01048579.1:142-636(+)